MSKSVQFTQTWHKHGGGPCPLPNNWTDHLTVQRRDGSQYSGAASLVGCSGLWVHLGQDDDIIAYTTDIFDGVFPEPVEEDPRLVEIRENACRKAREQQAEYRELCERREAAGWTFEGGRDGRGWIAPKHIPDAGKKVEPTRGAGCENEILP